MTNEELLKCLDGMAVALADHGHTWTAEERGAYERCISHLKPTSDYMATDSSV